MAVRHHTLPLGLVVFVAIYLLHRRGLPLGDGFRDVLHDEPCVVHHRPTEPPVGGAVVPGAFELTTTHALNAVVAGVDAATRAGLSNMAGLMICWA
jgi:hypothetical protein